MLILGVESSCDETAVAVVRSGKEVLSSEVASQHEFHVHFGGVVPEIAARQHQQVIEPLYRRALSQAGIGIGDIDAIAVTNGPGLVGAILVGASFAKGLALASGKALIPVNHVHAHVHGALLGVDLPSVETFPCLALVVSGGHTNLYRLENHLNFQLLASTADDACGEAFDKVGKILGLPYPGGPEIEKAARSGNTNRFPFPKTLAGQERLGFSYSGLKTKVAQLARMHQVASEDASFVADICASFQEEALQQIARQIGSAILRHPEVRSLVIAGGVAANRRFREIIEESVKIPAFFPPLAYCSDNAAMIAAMGYHLYQANPGSYGVDSFDWEVFSRNREAVTQ